MQLVFLRHAQTDYNAQNRFQALADIPLNETGLGQAREIAHSLDPLRWSAVYSSHLERAVRTASVVAGPLGVPCRQVGELRERDLGLLDGLDRAEYRRTHPSEMDKLEHDDKYAPPGGETPGSVLGRVSRGLARIVGDGDPGPGRSILVVTHGGVLSILARHLFRGSSRGMLGNGRAMSLRAAKTGSAVVASVQHWNVEPRICEQSWPREALHPPRTLPRPDHSVLKEVS